MSKQVGPALVTRSKRTCVGVRRRGGGHEVLCVIGHRELAVGVGERVVVGFVGGNAFEFLTRASQRVADGRFEAARLGYRHRHQVAPGWRAATKHCCDERDNEESNTT
jgi:hypothetical protein